MTSIPIPETFAIVSNSFLEGFFNTDQTLLHLIANAFVELNIFFIMIRLEIVNLKIY